MRRYTIKVAGTEHVMDVEAVDIDTFRVHLADGRVVDVDLEDHQDLAHAVISPDLASATGPHPDDRRAHAGQQIRPATPRPQAPEHTPRGHAAPSHATASASAPGGGGSGKGAGAGTLTAPMPGVVLSVEAPAGTTVSRGDVILVLEAMKMNNPLRAPKDGVVAAVMVEPGQNVAFGAPLATIESA